MATVFCHMCGTPLQDTAKFCKNCGTPVIQPEPAPAPVVEEAPVAPVVPEPVVEEAPVVPVVPEPVVEEVPVAPVVPEPVMEEAPVAPVVPEPVMEETHPEDTAPTYEPIQFQETEIVIPQPTPVEETPVPQPEAPKKKERYRKRGVGRTVGAGFICLLLFIFALASILVADVSQIFTGEFLSNTLTNIVEDVKLTEIPAKDLMPDIEDEDMSVIEWVINEVSDSSDGAVKVTEKSVEKFMKESNLDAFLSEKLQAYVDIFTGESDEETVITKEEIQELLEEQIPLAEEAFDVIIDKEQIQTFVDNIEKDGLLEHLEPKEIEKTIGLDISLIQTVSKWANVVLIILLVATALIALWLFANNRWNILRTLGDYGILATILGVIFTAVSVIGAFFESLWEGLLPEGLSALTPAIAGFLETTLASSLIILGAGILLIVVFVVGKKLIIKSAKKQV